MTGGSILAGFLAGMLSTLSPCVLPLLPLVLGAAVAAHRFGMLALGTGLVISFVAVGLFVATIGFSAGLTADLFRDVSAILLGVFGVILLSAAPRQRLALAMGGWGDAGNRFVAQIAPSGLRGQFLIGLGLGAIWSPCVGPTLGAASLLASRGSSLGVVTAVMLAFGAGAALPLMIVGSLSREALSRWRGRLRTAGAAGTSALGGAALLVSVLILTGLDHALETVLVELSPDWLSDLTTRF
jgi:cytochrome c-type biogenesis protein